MPTLSDSYVAATNGSKKHMYALFICLCVALMTLSGQSTILWGLWRISENPASAQAAVKNLDCANHGRVFYAFKLGENAYPGAGFLVDGAGCRSLRIGQPITVFYETGNPQNNYAFAAAGKPMHAFWIAIAFIGVFVLLGPLFLVFIWTIFSKIAARFNL
jgi:hypothetical protein